MLEAAGQLGGRARTDVHDGFAFNLGPHAVYEAGAGRRLYRELGIPVPGGHPRLHTTQLLIDGRPRSAPGLLRGVGIRGAADAARLLRRIAGADPDAAVGKTTAEWLDAHGAAGPGRDLVATLLRTATYSADIEQQAADAMIRQLRIALTPVTYVDGGWTVLVQGLSRVAGEADASVRAATPAQSAHREAGRWVVTTRDGRELAARALVLTGEARDVLTLLGDAAPPQLADRVARAVPARLATLDVALSRLPHPRREVVLGVPDPLYFSVHSAVADLAPPDGALIHTARYLGPEGSDPARDRATLEGFLDVCQPGWRDLVVHQRFLPDLMVAGDLPAAATGGLPGRPVVDQGDGLFLAGDWVGEEGLLSDASLASAAVAGRLAAAVGSTVHAGVR